MGFADLHLVAPKIFPSAEATARAAGADDILMRAQVHATLEEAVRDCALVFGTTARERRIDWPATEPRAAAGEMAQATGEVAIVFGRERSGLSNEELDHCQRAIYIPTSDSFRSLNLAQAVQICVYELRLALLAVGTPQKTRDEQSAYEKDPLAASHELDHLADHWLRVMQTVDYFDPNAPKLLERRLKRLVFHSELRHSETQIVRGFLTAVEKKLKC